MDREYTGIIVEESLDDNRILNGLDIYKVCISGHENPKDRWHLYQVHASKADIAYLAGHMIGTWYMHFWMGTSVTAIFSGNHRFEFDYSDRTTWKEVLEYGRSVGIPDEQLDFPIQGL